MAKKFGTFNKEKFKKRLSEKGSHKEDPRFLNYFDLPYNKTIRIRFLVNEKGELYTEWASHGPNLRKPGIKPARCLHDATGETCPACSHAFALREDKDEAGFNKWKRKNYVLAQVLVLDAPIDINEAEDGNPVKLFRVPFGIKDIIDAAIDTDEVEDPTEVDFVIKKRKKGDNANYDASYFVEEEDSMEIPDEVFDMFDSGDAYLYDLSKEVHPEIDADEMSDWLADAMEKVDGRVTDDADEDEDEDEKPRRSSSKRRPSRDDDADEVADVDADDVDEDADEDKKPEKRKASDLINKFKNRKRT